MRLSGVKKRLSGVLKMLEIKQGNVMNKLLTFLTILLYYYIIEKFLFSEEKEIFGGEGGR